MIQRLNHSIDIKVLSGILRNEEEDVARGLFLSLDNKGEKHYSSIQRRCKNAKRYES